MCAMETLFPTVRDAQLHTSDRTPYHSPSSSTSSTSSTRPSRPRLILPAALDADASPAQHAVSFSHWTRFSASPTKAKGHLKASLLCKATGTSSSYGPPPSEWVYLGVDVPIKQEQEQAEPRMAWREWKRQKATSWSSSSSSSAMEKECMAFGKQAVKRPSTESQLANALVKVAFGAQKMAEGRKNNFGLKGLRSEDLPSAFDSDDSDY